MSSSASLTSPILALILFNICMEGTGATGGAGGVPPSPDKERSDPARASGGGGSPRGEMWGRAGDDPMLDSLPDLGSVIWW